MDQEQRSLADVMAHVASSLQPAAGVDETLLKITAAALEHVPGVDYASISVLHRDGHIDTVAPTDDVILLADKLQYELRQGPCYEAVEEEANVRSPDVANDVRWPEYGPRVASIGIGAQWAFTLYTHARARAALNLYARQRHAFAKSQQIVELFSSQVVAVLGYANELSTLHHALDTRKAIGEAVGIVMERYGVGEDSAFAFLVRVSQTGNVKLRDVALEIVGLANQRDNSATSPL
ncbi:MAG: GAF and ANTAR domain-containing protein [Nocardioidaceae bacterium]